MQAGVSFLLAQQDLSPLSAEHVDLACITKVGEGTFGEAFKVTGRPDASALLRSVFQMC